ncbi:hypothetical protein N2152v2_008287 [Parachlorella kessleri]
MKNTQQDRSFEQYRLDTRSAPPQGFHNVAGLANELEYLNPRWTDAHLTQLGWEQTAALKRHLAGLPQPFRVDVVIVSPLTRTLETAAGVFGGGDWAEADGAGPPLMLGHSEEPGLRSARAAISAVGCPPFVAYEAGGMKLPTGCREHLGIHFCDKRRSLSEVRPKFPGVDFTLIEDDDDKLWQPDRRESTEELKRRGLHFIQWLMKRPESHIAVVSHGGLLQHSLSNLGRTAAPAVQGELHLWFKNCEMRSVMLADEGGTHHPDRWSFPGGHQVATKA